MRLTIVAVASLAAGTAFAQATPSPTESYGINPPSATGQPAPGKPGQPSSVGNPKLSDENFGKSAAAANQSQIKLGQLAVQKGTTEQVRKLGQTMVDDHTKANDRLRQIATREGFSLPSELTPEQKADYDRLSALSGSDFDTAYIDQLKRDQPQANALFRDEAQNGIDPQLKSFAKSTLPSLSEHERMANRPIQKM